MRKERNELQRTLAMVSAVLWATAEAMAQENIARPSRRIVVDMPDHKLAVLDGDRVVRVFDVATGAGATPSPAGSFTIVQRIQDPAWYHPGKVVPAGKNNPLGPRWIGLSKKGYGIHGTNAPASIGHNASHGCIRLRNADIEQLFEMVSVGDQVDLLAERTEETDRIFSSGVITVAALASR